MNENTAVDETLTGSTEEIYGEAPVDESPQDQTTEETTPSEETPTPTREERPTTLSREDITAAVREGVRQPPPQREYTREELNQMFNVWQPTTELVQRINAGGEDAVKAMFELRDGLSKQFGTLLKYQMDIIRSELSERMSPALSLVAEQTAAKDRAEFFSQHEDLQPHESLVQTVFNALKAEGYQAATKAEAYKTLADRTRALLPTTGGNGSGARQPAGTRTTTTPTKRPASLSSGSQAGGGGPSAPAAPFPGAEIWQD